MWIRSIAPALLVMTIGSGLAKAQEKAPAQANPLHYLRVPEPEKPSDKGWDKLSPHEQNAIIDRLNAQMDEKASAEAAHGAHVAVPAHYLHVFEPEKPGDPGWDKLSPHEQNAIIDRLDAAMGPGKAHYLHVFEPEKPGDPGWDKLTPHEQNAIIDRLNAAMGPGKAHYLRVAEPEKPGDPGWDKLTPHEQNVIIDRLNAAVDELPLPQVRAKAAAAPAPAVAPAKSSESSAPPPASHGFLERLDLDEQK